MQDDMEEYLDMLKGSADGNTIYGNVPAPSPAKPTAVNLVTTSPATQAWQNNYAAYNTKSAACHSGLTKVFKGTDDKAGLWIGGWSRNPKVPYEFAVIDLTGSKQSSNVTVGDDLSRKAFGNFLASFVEAPWLSYKVTDMHAPEESPKQIEALANDVIELIDAGTDVAVLCQGGHGRSGTMVCAILMCIADHKTMQPNPITWLRNLYCDEVVEAKVQIEFLKDIAKHLKLEFDWTGVEPAKSVVTTWQPTVYGNTGVERCGKCNALLSFSETPTGRCNVCVIKHGQPPKLPDRHCDVCKTKLFPAETTRCAPCDKKPKTCSTCHVILLACEILSGQCEKCQPKKSTVIVTDKQTCGRCGAKILPHEAAYRLGIESFHTICPAKNKDSASVIPFPEICKICNQPIMANDHTYHDATNDSIRYHDNCYFLPYESAHQEIVKDARPSDDWKHDPYCECAKCRLNGHDILPDDSCFYCYEPLGPDETAAHDTCLARAAEGYEGCYECDRILLTPEEERMGLCMACAAEIQMSDVTCVFCEHILPISREHFRVCEVCRDKMESDENLDPDAALLAPTECPECHNAMQYQYEVTVGLCANCIEDLESADV